LKGEKWEEVKGSWWRRGKLGRSKRVLVAEVGGGMVVGTLILK
jgi:hypothetical protein